MRVTFELQKDGKNFVLLSTVEFSEEEKAVIQQRGLSEKRLAFGNRSPVGSGIQEGGISSASMQLFARILVLVGFITIPFSVIRMLPELFPFIFFIGAFVVYRLRKVGEHRNTVSYETRLVTLGKLIANPTVRSYTTDPSASKALEENIRNQLTVLKEVITDSVTIPAKQTYEI
jgi:hypothetical protein